ncbi:MAG: adenosylcobinamide-phosphate synthase CbiB [Marinobacterium sp.]|nr:adenosylcobinamide-phosphate synthase CbiB [Marinobacterium sp.]
MLIDGWPLTVLICLLAVLLDYWLGEPRRYHPLVGFGALASKLERRLNRQESLPLHQQLSGWLGVALLTAPAVWLLALLDADSLAGSVFSVVVLYSAIGHKSLREHVLPVADALTDGDDALARQRAAMIVSRDPQQMDVPRACAESALENGSDGIFAALFWFLLAGAPGVVAYRLINTLDAMWGYRNERFLHFGYAAAKLDDLLNWLPARLTALSYAVLGHTDAALRCWREQAPACSSPNGGPVMAAGAGALQISLGGAACYHGQWQDKPQLGEGRAPLPDDIRRAMALVSQTLLLWLIMLCASAAMVLLYG